MVASSHIHGSIPPREVVQDDHQAEAHQLKAAVRLPDMVWRLPLGAWSLADKSIAELVPYQGRHHFVMYENCADDLTGYRNR